MATSVTVLGTQNQAITLTYASAANGILASQLASLINTGVTNGSIIPASDKNGPPPALAPGKVGEFQQTMPGLTILPTGYTAYATNAASAVVFGSGDPGEKILAGDATNLSFFATGGSGTVAAGGGNNLLYIPATDSGSWLLSTGAGDDQIFALGSGSNTITAGAGHNAIALGSGPDAITSTGDDTVMAGAGAATIDATQASSDVVYGGSGNLLFVGGAGGSTIFGGTGSDTFMGNNGTGPEEVHGGSAGHNFLVAGAGPATLFGGGDGDQLFAFGAQSQTLIGGSGHEVLSGAFSSGNDLLVAGPGNNSLVGGSGADTFVGGSGSDTVFASSASKDVFEFVKGQAGGSELVQNVFDSASVHIKLSGYSSTEAANALAGQTTNGSSVTLSLSDGTKITFDNITHLNSTNIS
jgi:Ca2+-binding RTX toxin-like protein